MVTSFMQGAAYALGTLNRNHDEPTMVAEVLKTLGVKTAADLRRAGVEEYDIESLKSALQLTRRRP